MYAFCDKYVAASTVVACLLSILLANTVYLAIGVVLVIFITCARHLHYKRLTRQESAVTTQGDSKMFRRSSIHGPKSSTDIKSNSIFLNGSLQESGNLENSFNGLVLNAGLNHSFGSLSTSRTPTLPKARRYNDRYDE